MISREKNRGRREAEVSGENEMPTGQEWNASGWEPQAQSSLKTDWLFWAGGRAKPNSAAAFCEERKQKQEKCSKVPAVKETQWGTISLRLGGRWRAVMVGFMNVSFGGSFPLEQWSQLQPTPHEQFSAYTIRRLYTETTHLKAPCWFQRIQRACIHLSTLSSIYPSIWLLHLQTSCPVFDMFKDSAVVRL